MSSTKINIDSEFKKYVEKLKDKGKIFCEKCLDDREVIVKGGPFGENICKDCVYMNIMLHEIKKI